ncbi:sec23/Sec24 zinc finger family protein [Klebsormidium nitens]|uniref:Sec23/Sec24 zinc finger family protein n=1 Tax=Klebsormidium nitens TaxID=105231 RepID=A0A1Y1HSD2_KLENI|nr:sec23/Sec24 zinc finger family protein [Klebsormidium nitens]|eukprot:GAQ81540.1 sec23/Sec24 zinc finger family protein [Klebsormidium nitens]
MAIRFSVNSFPKDGAVLDDTGLPWGCVVQPFAISDAQPLLGADTNLTSASDVARCEECFAYINAACRIKPYWWRCALCDAENQFAGEQLARYSNQVLLSQRMELSPGLVELDVPVEEDREVGKDIHTRPVYIAAVDLSAGEDFLELVKSALLAALEALPPAALFGLVTFSHKLGLYDCQGDIPVVKHVFIPPSTDSTLPLDLDDVMPLEALLAPVDVYKDQISNALDTLHPTSSWERTTAAGQPGDGSGGVGGRGFGTAMTALLKYVGGDENQLFVGARLFAFLSGPPDYGAGALDTSRFSDHDANGGDDEDKALLSEQTPYYSDLAALAVQSGVCCDVFVVSEGYCDLASLEPLCSQSGGTLCLYQRLEECTLPQDMYRMLRRPHAFGGLLRLRTSPEMRIVAAYGHFEEDTQYENLHHIISCDPHDTYAYDFDFVNANGFGTLPEDQPVVQMVFQYTVMLPREAQPRDGVTDNGEPSASSPTSNGDHKTQLGYVLRRRMRIRTVQLPIARTAEDLFDHADPEIVLSLLTHKLIRASLEEGLKEARILVQDWLVILTAHYNVAFEMARFGRVPESVDTSLRGCPPLQSLPRLVFALLRGPLLRFHREGVHPDVRTYLQFLYSSLDPQWLLRATYPVLSSYVSPDKPAYPRHSLSRAALVTSGSPIFLLDAFTTLIVYYAQNAPTELPFPPPQDCLIRETINQLKKERVITPRLLMLRGGHDNVEAFERYLIEEQDVDGAGAATGMGFVAFMNTIRQETEEFLKTPS